MSTPSDAEPAPDPAREPDPAPDPAPDADLTTTSMVVLGLLALMGEATSYDLKQAVRGGVGNYWDFPHSQLYAEPKRLVERGLLTEEREEGGRRRRRYQLTAAGRAALRRWLADPATRGLELRDEALLKVAFAAEAGEEELRALARRQQAEQDAWIDHDEGLARELPPHGEARYARATLEMGRRYRRLARQFWRDVEALADTGVMPTLEDHAGHDEPRRGA